MPIRSTRKSETYFDFFATSGNEADRFDYDPPPVNRGTRAIFAGGGTYPAAPNGTNTIDYITITGATGNANDFGDLVNNCGGSGQASNGTIARICGGAGENKIQNITFATTGNATDTGDLTAATYAGNAVSNGTRGVFTGFDSNSNKIDYFSFGGGDASDFGDLYNGDTNMGAVQDMTRGVFGGGANDSPNVRSNIIQYLTVATTGNTQDFGDLTIRRDGPSGVSDNSRGVFGGGNQYPTTFFSNVIDYITISSTGNATDFGDLTQGRMYVSTEGASGKEGRGAFAGGNAGPTTYDKTNVIDYITIQTTGNATDYGDLTVARGRVSSSTGT
tara:strand:+ start:95 stop:1087 length:993 start_codon:yes stop_codon:yes gene_type:complete